MSLKYLKASGKHAAKNKKPIQLIKLGLINILAGTTLLGLVSPAFAAENSTDNMPEELKTASAVLEAARETFKQKQEANAQASEYKRLGTAGYFKYKGAKGAYSILTDSAVSGKLAGSIKLGESYDATSLDNMIATITYLRTFNELRKSEGKPDLKVSDTLMAMAQADTDWASYEKNWPSGSPSHPQQFKIGENLSWGREDPFSGWYKEEKANFEAGGTEHGHYDNIVNTVYDITGFALRPESENQYGGTTFGQTFYFTSMTRSSEVSNTSSAQSSTETDSINTAMYMLHNPKSKAHTYSAANTSLDLWSGSRTETVENYYANLQAYKTWLSNPQIDVDKAQKALDAAQEEYNNVAARLESKKKFPTPKPSQENSLSETKQTAGTEGTQYLRDEAIKTNPYDIKAAADPVSNNGHPQIALASTGSNVLGAIALTAGLFLTAIGAFLLRRYNR